MPGSAIPVVDGKGDYILEYPHTGNCVTSYEDVKRVMDAGADSVCEVSESTDTGHRHFSGMHWLVCLFIS